MTGDSGVDKELGLVDQIQPVQLGRELAATEQHAGRGASSSIRELPLSPELVELLRDHWETLQEERALAGERWQDYNLVFPSEVGTPLLVRNLRRHYKAALKRASLPSTTRFHDLRHTAATLMLSVGVPLKTVSDILGHSSIQVTVDTYGFTFDEDKQRALDILAQTLTRSV